MHKLDTQVWPATHPSFPLDSNQGEFAGCGALWAELHRPTKKEAAKKFSDTVWRPRIKSLKPKEQPAAKAALKEDLLGQLQKRELQAQVCSTTTTITTTLCDKQIFAGKIDGNDGERNGAISHHVQTARR